MPERVLPGAVPPGGGPLRAHARRIAGILLAASAGIALQGGDSGRPAPEEGVPVPAVVRPTRPDTVAGAIPAHPVGPAVPSRGGAAGAAVRHGEDDDQPAGACWLIGGAAPSCVCSAGTIETLLTPDYMRALLTAWRDGGGLSTRELHARLQEVDAACGRGDAAP